MTEDEKRDLANRQAMRARRQSLKPEDSVAEKQIKAAQVQKMIERAANQAPLAATKSMPLPISKPMREQKVMPLPKSLPISMAIRIHPNLSLIHI